MGGTRGPRSSTGQGLEGDKSPKKKRERRLPKSSATDRVYPRTAASRKMVGELTANEYTNQKVDYNQRR